MRFIDGFLNCVSVDPHRLSLVVCVEYIVPISILCVTEVDTLVSRSVQLLAVFSMREGQLGPEGYKLWIDFISKPQLVR